MNQRRLLIEAGNSRCKALTAAGEIWTVTPPEDLPWKHHDSVVLLPTGARLSAAVESTAAAHNLPCQRFGRDLPVPNLGQYANCGLDRICAGLAITDPAIVIDAGSACTLTAWTIAERGRRPQFAGGMILPGMRACAVGLHQCAPALPLIDVAADGNPEPAAHSTVAAIANGLFIGWPGMVKAALEALLTRNPEATVWLTGGDAVHLQRSHLSVPMRHDPALVLRGMQLLVSGRAHG